MRTRNADNPKSLAAKKSPPAKKDSPATPNLETSSKTAPKTAPKTPKTASAKSTKAAAVSEAKSGDKVEELATPVSEKKSVAVAAKSIEKKSGGKGKSPLAAKAVVETPAKVDEVVVELKESKDDEGKKGEVEEEVLKPVVVLDGKNVTEGVSVENAKDEVNMEEEGKGNELDEEADEDPEEIFEAEEDAGDVQGEEEMEKDLAEIDEPRVEEDEQMEITGMAERWKIKKELEIFLGGLDRDATEEDIRACFEKIGKVVEVRLHKDFVTNKNKGFAFVKFATKELAAKALEELKHPVICGKRCGIAPSEDNDTLFMGNICNTWTKEAIKRKLKEYGVNGVENITLVPDTQNEGLSRGFAFLEFSCHSDAMLAYKRLQKPDAIFGHPERTAKVAFAEPLREPDPEVMAQVKSVFVDGLPPYWDEDRVKEQFKGYGDIERVVLARNMSTAKRNDFGFVNFTTHEAAVACVEGVNDSELSDGKSKIKARARLANPLPKTQAVKGGMSGGFRIGHTGYGYSRFGRGFGRGGYFPHRGRAGFQGGRGFNVRGRGRGGRVPFPADTGFEGTPEFFGRRPFGGRGGRGFSSSGRRGGYIRSRGDPFPAGRPPFPVEEEFGGAYGPGYYGQDPYFYGDASRGAKRSFSMMDHDSGYWEPRSRMCPRYDYPDLAAGAYYRDSPGMGGLYPREHYGPSYGSSSYPSMHGSEHHRGGYY